MKPSRLKKDKQLGMPFGTAAGRLRKALLFHVLKRHGENVCFRCNESIQTADELSLDHKVDWLDDDPSLFWDVENIAFSHRKCNRPGKLRGNARKVGPEGTAWCTGVCKAFLPTECFGSNVKRWNGLGGRCKKCTRENTAKHRKK